MEKTIPQAKLWIEKIQEAEKYRDKISKRYRWKEIVEAYKCQLADSLKAQDIYVPPLNYIYAYIKTEIPSIALRDPKIKVNPRKGASITSAMILEHSLAYLWRTKRTKRENKKNILDAKTVGHSWFKTGYTGQFGTVEDGSGAEFEYIKSEDFFGYRVPWDKITFNPDAIDIPFDCKWIAQEVWFSLKMVQENPAYNKEATALLKPSLANDPKDNHAGAKSEKNDNPDRGKIDPGTEMVRLYEVWNKEGNEKFLVSDQSEDYISNPVQWPHEAKWFPFQFLEFNDNPDCGYGIPDCYAFEPQVYELTKVRASELDHLKRYNRQLAYREGVLTEDAKEQFSLGITGAAVPVKTQAGEPVSNAIAPIQYAQLPSDAYAIERLIKEDMINVSGQSATERGATQQTSTRTFRELAQMDKGAKNRRSDQVDAFEDFVEDISRSWIALLQQFADIPFYVSVTGKQPQEIIQALEQRKSAQMQGAMNGPDGYTFTKEDIQGEFDVECVAGSTIPLDSNTRMQNFMEILSELPQLGVAPGGPVAATIGRLLAQELDMPELELAIEQEAQFQAQHAQQQQQQAQMQNSQLAAQQGAEMELKAQKTAIDQNKLMVEAYKILAEIEQAKRDERQGKTSND